MTENCKEQRCEEQLLIAERCTEGILVMRN